MFYPDEDEQAELIKLQWEHGVAGQLYVKQDGTILRANAQFCKIVGYTESELCRRTFQDITHPDDVKDDVEETKKIVNDSVDSYVMLKRYIHKMGYIVWIRLEVWGVRVSGEFRFFYSQVLETNHRGQIKFREDEPVIPKPKNESKYFDFFVQYWWQIALTFLGSVSIIVAGVLKIILGL